MGECVAGGMGEWRRKRGEGKIRRERNDRGTVSMAHRDGRESSNRQSGRQVRNACPGLISLGLLLSLVLLGPAVIGKASTDSRLGAPRGDTA